MEHANITAAEAALCHVEDLSPQISLPKVQSTNREIRNIITYGDGTGKNAGVCGVGEQWGNYFGALVTDREYGNGFRDHFNPTEITQGL
ncbi:MAG: hypothetical protein ACOCXH_11905 [Cyclobacteriaceae bacterium]